MSLETRIYQKDHNLNLFKLLKSSLADVYSSRFLSWQLTVRDIKGQYRQSYLGIFWAFVAPLTTAFVWIFLNGTGTVKLSDTGVPYPVFAFSGTLIWSIIKEAINLPSTSTYGAMSIISKINFPKEALIISGIYKLLFNSTFKIGLLIILALAYGIGFHWSQLLFPLTVLGAVLFGIMIGLFITPLKMLYGDFGRLVNFALGFLMYITPVVYIIPKSGVLKTIMELNPLTPLILTARDTIVGMTPEYLIYYFVVIACSIPLLAIGLVFYRISIPIIVERLG